MKQFIVPVVIFIVVIFAILAFGTASTPEVQQAVQQAPSNPKVITFTSFVPCLIIIFAFLLFAGRLISLGITARGRSNDKALYTEGDPTGDRFDPDSLRYGHTPGTFTVESYSGRKFIIALDKKRDMAAFQEVDRRGNAVGKPVLTNPHVIRFGKDPKKDLANHLRRKVEFKPPEKRDYPEHYY